MRANDYLRPGERIDDLQRGGTAPQEQTDVPKESGAGHENDSSPPQGGLCIIQDPSRFCFGMDAVLLSAYVQMKKARRGLDLGTGNGIIPILLSDRTDCRHLTGLEIQPASADLARRSVALNGLQDRISIVEGDIKEADRIFAAASFDFITCNPPYRTVGSGRVSGSAAAAQGKPGNLKNPENPENQKNSENPENPKNLKNSENPKNPKNLENLDPRAIARHELLCTFDDVARASARLLRPGGHFYLVHRPLRLPELITTLCGRGLEPKRMRLVYPHLDQAPNMVLLDCVRGGGPELRVEPPLIVYEKDGSYTPELMHIYYD
jgi:tRNA1Val (adenine37-N6)-methyltransferase